MGFYKNYPNRKDWRKQYRDSRRFDFTCRCHGSCSYCSNKRQFFDKKNRTYADMQLKEYKKGGSEC